DGAKHRKSGMSPPIIRLGEWQTEKAPREPRRLTATNYKLNKLMNENSRNTRSCNKSDGAGAETFKTFETFYRIRGFSPGSAWEAGLAEEERFSFSAILA